MIYAARVLSAFAISATSLISAGDAVVAGDAKLIRVACVGDSITYGSGIPQREHTNYPAQLQRLLGSDYQVRGFGVPGAGVLKKARRESTGWQRSFVVHPPFRESTEFQPNIVVINLGINDIAHWDELGEDFVNDYVELIEQYQQLASKPRIILWQPLAPLFPGQTFCNDPNLEQLNAAIATAAEQTGVETIDMRTPLSDHPEWFPDCLHPNKYGAARIAEVTAQAITGKPVPSSKRRRPPTARRFQVTLDDKLATSFEEVSSGAISTLETSVGTWKAKAGHAEIDAQHARTGNHSLHLVGGKDRVLEFESSAAADVPLLLSFWAERWTRRSPFSFRIQQQVEGKKWQEIYNGDNQVKVGGFNTQVEVQLLSAESLKLRLVANSPLNSGVLIDDLQLAKRGPYEVAGAQQEQPTLPALIGNPATAIVRLKVDVDGNAGKPPVVEQLAVATAGTSKLADVEQVEVYYTAGNPNLNVANLAGATQFGKSHKPSEQLQFHGQQPLASGPNYFWVSMRLKPSADLDGRLNAQIETYKLADSEPQTPAGRSTKAGQRLGVAVRRPGDDGVHTYRIPGLATTNQGTLIGVYDVRRRSGGDLPGDIDVGMSRSTDGGATWEPMQVIMDMGDDPKWRFDGVGDPTVMVDRETNTIWVAATWSHGNRSWVGSGPGMKPEETGQFMLVRSDDDGCTWSKPLNIIQQVKRPEWCFLLQGPGKGFTMLDGTLVLPAQYQDTPENKRLPRSTFIYSRDHGKTWKIATGAFDDTTEAQVVELEPGKLMINARYNREPHRVVMTTDDMGKTWQTHPTSRTALIEPGACMASLIHVDHELGSDGARLLFSNPNSLSGRQRMTIKFSPDNGATWPAAKQLLLDENRSAGYSCLSMIDDETVGILYEGSQAHMTFQRVKLSEINRPGEPQQ